MKITYASGHFSYILMRFECFESFCSKYSSFGNAENVSNVCQIFCKSCFTSILCRSLRVDSISLRVRDLR